MKRRLCRLVASRANAFALASHMERRFMLSADRAYAAPRSGLPAPPHSADAPQRIATPVLPGPSRHVLREHQRAAVDGALAHWAAGGERATVVMPGGSGKTLVGLAATEAVVATAQDGAIVVVVVPTLDLLTQTAEEFQRLRDPDGDWNQLAIASVSDRSFFKPSILRTAPRSRTLPMSTRFARALPKPIAIGGRRCAFRRTSRSRASPRHSACREQNAPSPSSTTPTSLRGTYQKSTHTASTSRNCQQPDGSS